MTRFTSGIAGKPVFLFLASFAVLIAIGAILFSLPIATRDGGLPFARALFMATSAVCVTGLAVIDVGSEMTPFGQWVLLALVQLGALGLMTFYAQIIMMAGNSISFVHRTLVREMLSPLRRRDFRPARILRSVAVFTLVFETLGAAAFYALFLRAEDSSGALKKAVFHAVSAFSNAGFSLYPDSFLRWQSDVGVNLVLILLIVSGGLGFLVLTDLRDFFRYRVRLLIGAIRDAPAAKTLTKPYALTLHSRIVLTATAALIGFGFLVFWLELLRAGEPSSAIKALFLSVTARTAGFNTVPTEGLASAVAVLLMAYMYIGASPGSTGGGVKTTTAFVLAASLWYRMRGLDTVDVFRKTIPQDTVRRAGMILLLGVGAIGVFLFSLLALEEGNPAIDQLDRPFLALLFESVSAFGTVGLSMGATARLSPPSLLMLSALMFIGRVGPMTLFIALSEPPRPRPRHPDELVVIG